MCLASSTGSQQTVVSADIIQECRDVGCRIRLISDGDVAAAVEVNLHHACCSDGFGFEQFFWDDDLEWPSPFSGSEGRSGRRHHVWHWR
jgi:hypothetical protein